MFHQPKKEKKKKTGNDGATEIETNGRQDCHCATACYVDDV